MRQLIRLFYTTVVAVLLVLPFTTIAQQRNEEEYKKYSDRVQQEIWKWDLPAFSKANIAAADSKASAVILARHIDIKAITTKKLKFSPLDIHMQKDLVYTNTMREMVKINDKAALEEYSQIRYQQFVHLGTVYSKELTTTIVGARILKPDGKIKEVNVDEAVFVKNEKNDKQRKLAIPDLQVGDVLDYFVSVEEQKGMFDDIDPQTFVLGDDKPIQHYSVHCKFSDKYAIQYRSINGAPEFKVKRDDDGMELDLEMKNIPSMPVTLWMSPYRQIPIVRMNILMGIKGSDRKPGEVNANISPANKRAYARIHIRDLDKYLNGGGHFAYIEKLVAQYKRQHKSKMPADSLPYFVYDGFRYISFYRVKPNDKIVVGKERNSWRAENDVFIYYLSWILYKFDIPNDIVLVTSKYGPRQEETMSPGDYVYMVRTKKDKPVLMSADGIFTHCGDIPSEFEAQQASTNDLWYRNKVSDSVFILETKATDNVHIEKMVISLENNLQQALVNRTTTLKGHMREDGQKSLLLFEDYYEEERRALYVKESFMEEFADSRRNKTLAEEYKTAFEKARKEQEEQFKAEIKEQFDQEPKELKAFHIDKMGLRHTDPDFVYTTQFLMEGWVKKAGNNYILDAGKLIGGQLQLKPEQRNRQVDVYMPFARSFEYNIELQIPAGYQLEGVAQLNQQVDNDCGSFTVTASTAQNKLLLTIRKVYKHSYEPVAKWPSMLQMLDAATSFESRKLLLKKA